MQIATVTWDNKGFQPSITSNRNANDFILNDYLILNSFNPMLENSHTGKSISSCYKTAESHGTACRAMRELVDGPHSAWVETANGLLRPSMQPPGHGTGADWQAAVRYSFWHCSHKWQLLASFLCFLEVIGLMSYLLRILD